MFRYTLLQVNNTILVYSKHNTILKIRVMIYLLRNMVLKEILIPSSYHESALLTRVLLALEQWYPIQCLGLTCSRKFLCLNIVFSITLPVAALYRLTNILQIFTKFLTQNFKLHLNRQSR